MYVIFPADEVVYLSYGRLILVPNSQETGRETETSSTAPSVQRISDNRCSNPSVPSTSTSSTRSFHSVISGPSLSTYSEDLQESSRLRRGDLETLQGSVKSNRSWPQPSTSKVRSPLHEPPIKPSRKKKRIAVATEICKKPTENIEKPFQRDTVPDLQAPLQRNNSRSSNTVPATQSRNPKSPNFVPKPAQRDSQDRIQSSIQRSNSKSSNPGRKLSYSDYVTVYTGEENEATIESLENSKPEGNPSSLISPRVKLARSLEKEKLFSLENEKDVPLNPRAGNPKPNPKGYSTHKRTKSSDSSKTKVSRERSPKASSSIDRENTPVNSARAKNECEYLSVGEETLSKSSARGSSPNTKPRESSLNPDSRLQLSGLQQLTPEKTPPAKKSFFGSVRGKRTLETAPKMAGTESPLRDLTHPSYNEALKAHNAVTFKLVRTVSDFTQQLGQIYEQHAEELQLLVSNFKKKNGELRKERPACPSSLFHTWETLLQEVEIDSQALGDIASILGRQVSRPLLERSFCRKIQSRKVFSHRESYETIVTKTEEKLAKCRQEYKTAYLSYLSTPTTESLSAYFNNHNAYVQQLHATNGMLEAYGKDTLPQLLQEIDEIYTDLCSSVSDAILQGAEVVSARANERYRRYESLISQCRAVSGTSDLAHLARSLPAPQGRGVILRRAFAAPQPPVPEVVDGLELSELQNDNIPPPLKNELVIDRLSAVQVQPAHDALKKESADLEGQIRQIHDSLETLLRIQQRSLESALYNKANELQEDISMKRFDLRVAQMHLSAIHSQKELFLNKLENADSGRERKMSSASTGSMKNKWLKAFKSLKTPPPSASPKETEKKNGSTAMRDIPRTDPDAHNFQEYTYKKITPCDVCSQILRGHTRQGLKCRFCKMNVHVDCQDKAPKCQPKSRLLRRQKSTSEIESRVPESTVEEEKGTEVDQIYQVLKQAGEISNNKPRVNLEPIPPIGITVDRGAPGSAPGSSGSSGQSLNRKLGAPPQPHRAQGSSLTVNNPAPCSTSSDRRRGHIDRVQGPSNAETSSMRRRLFAGMKSLTGFGSRSRQGSPGHRSISLPETPHSPRRQKLNLRMKSLSLDSPESTEHVQRRRHHGVTTTSEPHSKDSSSSRIQFPARSGPVCNIARSSVKARSTPSSPVHNRRLLSAKNIRMSSVELPDENDKSPSSASTSPCPSPVGAKKSHRLLPTNLYVVLYNFKSRHQDELDLKAGDKVTVIDFSDPDWWKGKCLGRVGYFPSKYCSKLAAGEKPLQVTHNLQLSDGDNGLMLLRDQIVIQIGEEIDGMVMIRSGDSRQGVCPVKFLQEV